MSFRASRPPQRMTVRAAGPTESSSMFSGRPITTRLMSSFFTNSTMGSSACSAAVTSSTSKGVA